MDTALAIHGEAIRTMLAAYLDHLATVWRSSDDSATAVASVLHGSCRTLEVPADATGAVARLLRRVGAVTDGPLALMRARLPLAIGEELLVATAWWSEVDPQLGSVFGVLHDDGARRHPSSGLVHLIGTAFGIDVPVYPRRLIAAGVVDSDGPTGRLVLTATAREILAGQLDGARSTPAGDDRPVPDRSAAALADLLVAGDGPVVVRGDAGSGRRRLAAAAAARLGAEVVGDDRPAAELSLLARLGIAVPVVPATAELVGRWRSADGPLIAVADPDDVVAAGHVLELAGPDVAERRRLWSAALTPALSGDDALARRLAEQFCYGAGDIDATVRRAVALAAVAGRPLTPSDVWSAAQQRPDHQLGTIATRVDPVFCLDDLVLPDHTAARLRQLVAHVEHRTTVLDDWGFRRRLARGSGIAALFAGPPGTGKTTAAEAIANELGTVLFRVDLSRVVSKYIGETEKNLAVAFRQAERSGAMLLFDEADALFGKRTEVRDAHDRYANLEVSYLLQRVETFTGLVVLSTNRLGNIDDAFLRRLRFVVRFQPPTRAERGELWQRSFPGGAAVGELDFEQLAAHDLAGGHIQSAALAAAFLAADNGQVIEHHHLDQAIADEYEKLDRAAPITRAKP